MVYRGYEKIPPDRFPILRTKTAHEKSKGFLVEGLKFPEFVDFCRLLAGY
jgi:hypothetical protein